MDEVDFTVLAAKSVFSDMIEKCPPAETCRDAFDRTAKATMKMVSSNGGFGVPFQQPRRQRRGTMSCMTVSDGALLMKTPTRHRHRLSEQAPLLSPSDGMSQDDASSIDPSLIPSPHGPPSASFTGQQFGSQDPRRYPDAQKIEFLHSGELSSADQENNDLGFGMSWDDLHSEFREGQHIDPFDTFFFGGQ